MMQEIKLAESELKIYFLKWPRELMSIITSMYHGRFLFFLYRRLKADTNNMILLSKMIQQVIISNDYFRYLFL